MSSPVRIYSLWVFLLSCWSSILSFRCFRTLLAGWFLLSDNNILMHICLSVSIGLDRMCLSYDWLIPILSNEWSNEENPVAKLWRMLLSCYHAETFAVLVKSKQNCLMLESACQFANEWGWYFHGSIWRVASHHSICSGTWLPLSVSCCLVGCLRACYPLGFVLDLTMSFS